MTAASPFCRGPPVGSVRVTVKPLMTVTVVPLLRLNVVVLNLPVRVALVMRLSADIGLPVKEMPSELSVKNDEPKVWVEPSAKWTVRLRLERKMVLLTGQVVSGKMEEFGPV